MRTSFRITSLFTAALTVAFLVFMGVTVVSGAWNEPAGNPPDGNVAAPINVGNLGQFKAGGIIVNKNGSNENTGLGIWGGGSLDLSGIIRIINPDGSLAPNGEGQFGDVLARTQTGMAWQAGSDLPSCIILDQTPTNDTAVHQIDVPDQCLNEPCTLVLARTTGDGNGVDDIRGTTYYQAKDTDFDTFGPPFFTPIDLQDWWVRPGIGADGVPSDCGGGAGRGRNGSTKGCDRLLQFGSDTNPILALWDDWTGTGGESNRLKWTLRDNHNSDGLSLILCD